MPGFNIRDWMREYNVTLPVNDPAVREEIAKLLRRDLSERFAASEGQPQPNQGRTEHRNTDAPERADAETA